jgi:cytoskeleton protein RodZ
MVAAVRTEPETAGARLARARERLGLSLDQVADHLKLDPDTVVALEQGDHRAIGASVFVRGFLRRYATLVGESPAEIEALYAQQPDAEARPDLSKTGMHRIEPAAFRPRLGVWPALIAAVALAIAGAAWWAMYSKPQEHSTAGSGLLAPGAPALAAGAPAPSSSGPDVSAQPTAADVKPEPVAGRRKLQLSFTGECWAEIYDARGWRLFFGFGHAGTAQELSGVAPFRLVLGHGEAVSLAMDGSAVSLPAGPPGQRVRILLGANGAATALP